MAQEKKNGIYHWRPNAIIFWLNRHKHDYREPCFTPFRRFVLDNNISGQKFCEKGLRMGDQWKRVFKNVENKKINQLITDLCELAKDENPPAGFEELVIPNVTVPFEFLDSVTMEVCQTPVRLNGLLFELESLVPYIKKFGVCPISKKKCKVTDLVMDIELKKRINEWWKMNQVKK